MSGVEGLQQGGGLPAANLADHDDRYGAFIEMLLENSGCGRRVGLGEERKFLGPGGANR